MITGESADSRVGTAEPASGGEQSTLSASQRRLWFLSQYDDHDAYVIARATRFRGPLDIEALRSAHLLVADRHEILRTSFGNENGRPSAVISPPGRIDFTVEDVSEEDTDIKVRSVGEFLADAAHSTFDLAGGPIWRIRVGRLSAYDHIVVTAIHHVAADGWSFPVLRHEVSTAYRALTAGLEPDLPLLETQYRDHANNLPAPAASLDYWRQRFGDDPDPIPLLGDRPRPHRRSHDGSWVDVGPLEATSSRLREVAARCGGSTFMVGLAVFAAFLGRISRTDEVIIGIPHADRGETAAHGLIGPFVNTLPLRIAVPAGASLVDQMGIVRAEMMAALDHAAVAFEDIVKAANPRRDPSHTPLFQAMYQFHDGAFRSDYELPGLTEENVPIDGATSKFDLLLEMSGVDGPVGGSLNFSSDIFDVETGTGLARALGVMTDAALGSPETALDRLPMLDQWERQWIVSELNASERAYPESARLWDLFVEVADTRRDEMAIEEGDSSISYGDLRDAALAISSELRELGIRPGEAVGLEMERSTTLVAAMLAVVEASAAYVPLDPSYPETRRLEMVDQCGLRYVIRAVGDDSAGFEIIPTGRGDSKIIDSDAAYVMFTSGSMGRPKGTVITHRAVARLVCNPDYVSIGPGDVIAHLSNTSFDAATFEVWGALLNGATLRVIDVGTVIDPAGFARALAEYRVTTVFVTTALFNVIARHQPTAFATVRDVLFGGEKCNVESVRAVLAAGRPRRLVHVYGPTESTTFASWYEVPIEYTPGDTVPIGGPVVNTTLHVVDRAGEPVPPGVVGELWIGGDGLALGYLDEPDLTADRFVPDTFGDDPWGRLYRTGDLVRRRNDGAIEFVGRNDRQLKLRGFRIEPEEVERALRSHPDVSDALVALRPGDHAGLGAWAVPAAGRSVDATLLVDHLRRCLPAYTVPASIAIVPEIPIGPNGKVDLSLLPVPVEPTRGDDRPMTASTAAMIEAFERVLGKEGVAPSDSFFDLGGHSLLAVELVSVAERLTGYRLPLASLFDDATPSGLARLIDEPKGHDGESGLVTFGDDGPETPVFLFHHPSGTVLAYQPLARRIGHGRAVYGVQARGIDGSDRPAETIEEMALDYADRIERAKPEGSLALAGHSLGGLLAWETAIILRRRGRQIALLALLDSRVPHRGWVDIDGEVRQLTPIGMMRRRLRRIGGDAYYGARYASFALRGAAVPPELARIRQIRSSSRAFEAYRPTTLDEHVVFFAARGSGRARPPVPGGRPSEDDWRELAGTIDVVEVPGTHTGDDSLLAEPNVEVLAEELRVRIEGTARQAESVVDSLPGPLPA